MLLVTSIAKNSVQSSAPVVHFAARCYCDAVIVSCRYLFHFEIVVSEELYFLRIEIRLKVTVSQRAYFLCIHPVEKAFLASVAPGPDASVL